MHGLQRATVILRGRSASDQQNDTRGHPFQQPQLACRKPTRGRAGQHWRGAPRRQSGVTIGWDLAGYGRPSECRAEECHTADALRP